MKYFFLSLCILLGSFFVSSEQVFAVINLNPATTTVSMSINSLNTQNGTIGFKAHVMNTGIIPSTPTYSVINTLSVNNSGVASTSFSGLVAGGSYLVQIKSYPLSDPTDLSLDQEKPFQTQAQSPTLTSLSVTSGNQGQVMTVNMTGTNFVNGATANFGANISNTITFVSPTLLKADIIIANNASAGPRSVTVTSGGNTTAPKTFTVVANQGTAFSIVGASPVFTAEPNDPSLAHVTMTVTFNGDPMSAPAAGITLVTSTDNPATVNTVYNGPVTGSAQTVTGNSYAVELSNVPLNTTYSYIIKNATTGATMYGPKTFTASLNTTPPPTDACPNEPGVQPTGPCNNMENDVCTNEPGIQPPGTQCQTVLYTLLEPIMGVTAINTASDLATFFNFLFKMLIGLCSLLAVIMIIIGGIEYLTTEAFTGKSNARDRIENAVTGLVLLAAIYLILYTINPNLLRLNIDLKAIETHIDGVTLSDVQFISDAQFSSITGHSPIAPAALEGVINSVAQSYSIDACAIKAIIEKESNFRVGAIGHDENAGLSNPASRTKSAKAFVASLKKYTGTVFTTSTIPSRNDDETNDHNVLDPNSPGLGLDWRFSHGIGLMQVTFFPPAYQVDGYTTNPPAWSTRNTHPTRNGQTPKQMMTEATNISNGALIYKNFLTSDACGNDPLKAFSAYNAGTVGCTTPTAYGQIVFANYTACMNGQ